MPKLSLVCDTVVTFAWSDVGMNVEPHPHANDPEASEGAGDMPLYDPGCHRSVHRAGEQLRKQLGLSYTPVLASPRPRSWFARMAQWW